MSITIPRITSIAITLLTLASGRLFGAGHGIHGRILDINNDPVRNVLIREVATAEKTLSSDAGEFEIVIPESAKQVRLVFECRGFYTQTVVLDSAALASLIEVVLTPLKVLKQDITVVAPRLDIPLATNPAATSVVGPDTLDAMPRAIAANEPLAGVPGVKVDNQADGERLHLSIRGQGILTERGIRGIQVVLDGLPLNDPSGFVPDLYDVDWSDVQEIQVVRGPVAFLYGGGSAGGIINIQTRDAGTTPLRGSLWDEGGANGFYKTQGEASGTSGGVAYLISAARTAGDGYRQHTGFWGNNFYSKVNWKPAPQLQLNLLFMATGYFNQNAEGLNLTQLSESWRLPNPDALTYNEWQKTQRVTAGVTGRWEATRDQGVGFAFYFRHTHYDEPVPSSVDHRALGSPGGSVQYEAQGGKGGLKQHFTTGLDLDGQYISDLLHPNLGNAVEGSALLADQSIRQQRVGAYALERLALGRKWTLLAGARFDRIGNQLVDHLKLNGEDLSGSRVFTHATGRVGVTWNANKSAGLYASWGQGFLPPATEELYANPDALGGFNRRLVAATSSGEEAGVRGALGNHFFYDASVFHLTTKNDFERYRIVARPLETFYANAGQSSRYGTETSLRWLVTRRLTLSSAYTYSHFTYSSYNSLKYPGNLTGNFLPNSPKHQLYTNATFELPHDASVQVNTLTFSRAFVDPTNAARTNGYNLLGARLSKGWRFERAEGSFFVSGTNLAAKKYIAFSEPDPDGNSYHPGPLREVFAGMEFHL